tara:strand:+ start:234 stop:1097 length:864 start_codon:yes stop_codon:yes gene_type:complete
MILTIGVPTYNRSKKLSVLFECLKKQEFNDFEIIVSDNCSTDNTKEICDIYKTQFKKFRYTKQTQTIHVLDNYKYLFDTCSTKYFMWLPDDDIIDNSYIKRCYDFIIKNKDYVLVSGLSKYYSGNKFIFKGKEINISDDNVSKRVYKLYGSARDNGNFYGIYNKEIILNYLYPKKYVGDLIFLSNVILFGKFKCLNSISIHRDLGGGTSGSLEGIIKYLNLSKWHSYFFHYISACEIFKNSTYIKKKYANQINLDIFFSIFCFISYLKNNLFESIIHIIKRLFTNRK